MLPATSPLFRCPSNTEGSARSQNRDRACPRNMEFKVHGETAHSSAGPEVP
jgi:hypothetical protein